MKTLSIDLETYSEVDIKTAGACAYVNHPSFEILLFACAYDDEPVFVLDLTKMDVLPDQLKKDIFDPSITKMAFNANFERTCLTKFFQKAMPAEQWNCTAVHALTLGMPGSLAEVSSVLKMPVDKAKMGIGKQLINLFCKPCKPSAANGMRTRNLPGHFPDKWEIFKQYNAQDVEAEREARRRMMRFQPSEIEHKIWVLDQKINDRGVRVDISLVQNAIACDAAYQERLLAKATALTGLQNPKSVAQLKRWLEKETGEEVASLNKEAVPGILAKADSETVKQALGLRQEMAKTSVKKYEAMARALCDDGRVRGLLQFYGANRTGRWAGRLVQVQNLPKNTMADLDLARQLVRNGDFELLELFFDSVPSTLSQLIRTAFIPADGCRFIVADFSAIEARVIAWLAGEQWRQEVFKGHGYIYEASASTMFHVPWSEFQEYIDQDKKHPLRQKGKVAELALGYQGGPGALVKMGALKMGLKEEELPELVKAWRAANPHIVQFWWDIQAAAIAAVREKTTVTYGAYGLTFSYEAGMMFIRLPSGRRLAYVRPRLEREEKFDRIGLTYEGMNQETKKWERVPTYGGKLVENIVQATARDCLRDAMLRLDAAGYQIVMHVHDEAVIEAPREFGSVNHACEIMGQPLPWAPGLLLRADGYETDYYKKDD